MYQETAEYLLSCYQVEETLKDTSKCCIQVVRNSLDGKRYLKKTYPVEKETIFSLLKEIDSKHIPSIIEVISYQGTIVIEEYIEGQSLQERLASHRLNATQVKRLTQQLLEVLDTLHSYHIIHRDIKPENIIIDEQENLWLIDFDIARLYQPQQTQDTQSFGTVGYAPPEQYGFSQTDARADLYSAGVTIEEMCRVGGCPPFSLVARVAQKCRAFDPDKRYASAKEALRHLKRGKTAFSGAMVFLLGTILAILGVVLLPLKKQKRQQEETWIPIVTLKTQKEYGFLPLEQQKEYQWTWPDSNLGAVKVYAVLKENALSLRLEDERGQEEKLLLQHLPQFPPDYTGTSLEGELILLDINEDGIQELLVALSDRKRMTGGGKTPLCNTNWRAVWCVGYTTRQGFVWQEEEITAYGNHDTIVVNALEGGEISNGETYFHWTDSGIQAFE